MVEMLDTRWLIYFVDVRVHGVTISIKVGCVFGWLVVPPSVLCMYLHYEAILVHAWLC